MQERTASVGYDVELNSRQLSAVLDILNPAHADPPAGKAGRIAFGVLARGLKSAENGVSALASGGGEGAADFGGGVCLLRRRFAGLEYETYYEPARVLQRRVGGAWRQKRVRPFNGSQMFSPIWLVELLRGTTRAAPVGDQSTEDQPLEQIRAAASPYLAAKQSVHGMDLQPVPEDEVFVLSLDVWLDGKGRVVRLIATLPSGEPDDIVKEWTTGRVELHLGEFARASVPRPPAVS